MKAILHTRIKEQLANGSVVSIVIWSLQEKDASRPHGYKYRLNFSTSDGTTVVRYDNERGKGDHKHIGALEIEYQFEGVEKLLADFLRDVRKHGER